MHWRSCIQISILIGPIKRISYVLPITVGVTSKNINITKIILLTLCFVFLYVNMFSIYVILIINYDKNHINKEK